LALFECLEVVSVSTASTIDELLALSGGLVEVIPGEVATAHTSFSFELAQVVGFALFRFDAFTLGVLRVSLLAGASNDALKSANLGWVVQVVASQRTGGAALLEFLIFTANGFAGALFWQDAFSLSDLDVSHLAQASNDALLGASLGWVVNVVACQGAGSSAAGEFLVFSTNSICSSTAVVAFIKGLEVVFVSSASAVDEFLALAAGLVEEIPGEVSLASPGLGFELTEV